MHKKHEKCPQNVYFPQFVTPKIFFKNRALSLLFDYEALSSCKKLQNYKKWTVSEISKDGLTEGLKDGRTGAIT